MIWAQTGIEQWSGVYHLAFLNPRDGSYHPICQTNVRISHLLSRVLAAGVAGLRLCQRCASYKRVVGGSL